MSMVPRPLTELFQNIEHRRVPWRPGPFFVPHGGGPSLDLSFVGGTLDPRITFSRASTATYFDATGTMQTAATNVPRFDADPVTHVSRGLLIEDARTNAQLSSGNLAQAPWAPAATGTAPTVTANSVIAPDGTLSGARIVMPAVPTGSNAAFVSAQTGIGAVQSVYSVWLRGASGGEVVNVFISNFVGYFHITATLTTAWQRFSVVGTPSSTGWGFSIGTDMRDPTQTPTGAQTFYAWGAQSEAGAFPTSYIPTTGTAVTRSQDVCRIPPANMGFFASPGGSWGVECILINPANAANNPRIVGLPAAGGGGPGQFFANTTLNLGQYDQAAAVTTAAVIVPNAVTKGASTWAAGTGKVCLNGGAVATGAMATGYGLLVTGGIGFMTVANPGVSDNASGYMRRLSYWPRVLSDTEMQQVTT